MRKRGKFEAPAPKKTKGLLLQSYLISLMCLVMCGVMFLGTTMAWFTSDVTSSGNQIYIGILKAGLYHEGVKINDDPTHMVFDSTIVWEPGMETTEELKITNEGDLAFHYSLQFLASTGNTGTETALTAEEIAEIAQCFEVSYLDTAAVVNEEENWTKVTNSEGEVATLAEILEQRIPIFKGEMAPGEGNAKVYKLKLYFKELSEITDLMGKTLRIDVRLIASQKVQEYPDYKEVEVTQTDLTDFVFEPYTVYRLTGNAYTAEGLLINVDNVVLQGNGDTVIDMGASSVDGQAGLFVGGSNVTVRDLTVTAAGEGIDAIKVSDRDNAAGMVKNVTLKNLTVSSESGHGINLHSVDGAVVDEVNFVKYGKAAISLAKATDIKITGCTTPDNMGWAGGCDIACQYSSDEGTTYNTPCSFSFDGTNNFGNGVVYSTRPSDATGGKDVVAYPENWVMNDAENGWALMNSIEVASIEQLKSAFDMGYDKVVLTGDITMTEQLVILAGKTVAGENGATLTVPAGVNQPLYLKENAKLEGLKVIKGDTNAENLVYMENGASVVNCEFTGKFTDLSANGGGRAIEVQPGARISIIGNTFSNLRQPAYINNDCTGIVENNTVISTRGFVVCSDSDVTFTGNAFSGNAVDICIISSNTAVDNYKGKAIDMSIANNGAYVENQVSAEYAEAGVSVSKK